MSAQGPAPASMHTGSWMPVRSCQGNHVCMSAASDACVHGPTCMNRHACCFSSSNYCYVHACVCGCLRDRHHVSADIHSAQTRAWRIEFPYRNIREQSTLTKGRVREAAYRTRPFVKVDSSRIFLYESSILHDCPKCTFVVGRPNISVLIPTPPDLGTWPRAEGYNTYVPTSIFTLRMNYYKERWHCIIRNLPSLSSAWQRNRDATLAAMVAEVRGVLIL